MKLQNTIISLILVLSSCKVMNNQKNKEPLVNELILLSEDSGDISIKYFKKRHSVNSVNQIIKLDLIYDSIKEEMIYSGKSTPVKLITLVSYYQKNGLYEKVVIKNGYLTDVYKASTIGENNHIFKTIKYKKGDMSGKLVINSLQDNVLYKTTFKKGNGYWKDYYIEGKLREEGNVKKNYKIGVWKYYNLFGKIDSTKTYTLKDSIDVRFPYYFFNKN